jgi:cytochrome c
VAKKLLIMIIGVFAAVSPVLKADDSSNGKAIFDRICARCHRTPAAVQTPATDLATRLAPGAIRQHRFQLTEGEQEQVIKYINSVRP